MKIFNLYIFLLFMIYGCKGDDNSTTTILPFTTTVTTVATTVEQSYENTTTTFATAPATTIPTTTTTIAATTSSTTTTTVEAIYDYEVCGNVTQITDCTCKNGTLNCEPSRKRTCRYSWDYSWCFVDNPPFNSTNIKILNETFVVKTAKFSRNKIPILQKNKFLPENGKFVERLELNKNEIKYIENGTFDNFSSVLETINLSQNSLSNLSGEVLSKELGLTLKNLDISSNNFYSIKLIDFSNLINLKALNFYGSSNLGYNNSFMNYTFPIGLSNLTFLNLASCGITFLSDDAFLNLMSLETLFLFDNRITSFPSSVMPLENLKFLDLDNTYITILNNTDTNVTSNLEKLSISDSYYLKKIDDCAFCNFPNLKELRLYRNHELTYIHENAFGYNT